jgi:CHAP domain-containing protein
MEGKEHTVSGTPRKPTRQASTFLTETVTPHAARLCGGLADKLNRQTLTRVTGGVAVGAALAATVAATAGVSDNGVPRSGPSLAAAAVADHESTSDFLTARTKDEQAATPQAKVKKAPTRPEHRPITADDVIHLAEKQVGISETNGEGGGTKFQDWYSSTERAKETVARDGGTIDGYEDAAWCAMFISWLGDQLDFNDEMGFDAWTIAHASWFDERGRWGHTPKPGAVVFFDWDGGKTIDGIDHVGLVVKDNGDGTIETIEGNSNNEVEHRTRSTDLVAGYGYPDYAKSD